MPEPHEPGTPAVGRPGFCHRDAVLAGRDRLFDIFQLPDPIIRRSLFASLLVENGIVLLTGTYGTGKTQLVHLVRKLFFSDGNGGYEYDYETCHQELTAFDVLYHLDLAELQRGREVVHPKRMLTARLKFLNEIQRANASFFNSLLPLLSERRVTYRDVEWAAPDFLCVMDRNPLDSGSSEIPEAFLDRVDFSFEIPAIHLEEHVRLQELRRRPNGFHWGGLDELTEGATEFGQLLEIWEDVKRVDIPARATHLSGMLVDAFRLCIVTERSNARPDFDLNCADCQFKGEICSHLSRVPGQRVTNSLLRLAQALAWVDGAAAVADEHLFAAAPWSLAHRVALRPEELRKQPSELAWLQEVAIGQVLTPRRPYWDRALQAYDRRDAGELEKLGANDIVVRELLLLLGTET